MKALQIAQTGLIISFTAACLTGCVSAPVPSNPDRQWAPPQESQAQDPVWERVRARSLDFTHPMPLAELVDVALKNSPATRSAWNQAQVSAARVRQAQGLFMPALTATGEAKHRFVQANPSGFDEDYSKFDAGLQMNYLVLSFGGGRRAAVEAALQFVYAADFTFNRTLQDVLLSVETGYYALVSAQAGIEAAEASVNDSQAGLDAARHRLSAGVGTQLDVLQAQTVYDQALYARAGAQGTLQAARGDLARAIGVAADTEVPVALPSTNALPESITESDMGTFIDNALQRRPDIAALRATLAARDAAVTVAGAALWPSLYLNADLSRESYDSGSGRTFQDNDWAYGAGVSLKWNLFDGRQTRNARQAAQAEAESARALLEQAELAAGAEVWVRYRAYETALQKVQFSATFLDSASASYDLALDSYSAGLSSILDLLNATALLAQARSRQIAARQDALTALAYLAHATGLLAQGGEPEAVRFLPDIRKDGPQ